MMRSIACGQRRHPPPKSPSQVLRLVVYFRVILQFKCIMWLKRMLQKNSIPRLVVVDMLERLIRQSSTLGEQTQLDWIYGVEQRLFELVLVLLCVLHLD